MNTGFFQKKFSCSLLVLNRYAQARAVLANHHRHHLGKGSVIAVDGCAQCFFNVGLDRKGQGGYLLCCHNFQRCFFAVVILQFAAKLRVVQQRSPYADFYVQQGFKP